MRSSYIHRWLALIQSVGRRLRCAGFKIPACTERCNSYGILIIIMFARGDSTALQGEQKSESCPQPAAATSAKSRVHIKWLPHIWGGVRQPPHSREAHRSQAATTALCAAELRFEAPPRSIMTGERNTFSAQSSLLPFPASQSCKANDSITPANLACPVFATLIHISIPCCVCAHRSYASTPLHIISALRPPAALQ